MKVRTYPEMNETIKELLKMNTDNPFKEYTLVRIEELEDENKKLKQEIERLKVIEQAYEALKRAL